jgi:transposase
MSQGCDRPARSSSAGIVAACDLGHLVERQPQLGWASWEIVRRTAAGFAVRAKRWHVERTIAWLGRCRRMARDHEACAETTEAWMYPAMIRLLLRRLRPPPGRNAHAAIWPDTLEVADH